MCKLRVRALSWPFIVKVGLVGGQLGLFVLPLNKGLNGRYTHDVCNDGQNLTKGVEVSEKVKISENLADDIGNSSLMLLRSTFQLRINMELPSKN